MEAIEDIVQNTTVADIVKRARERSYAKRIPKEVEKQTKDLGGILVPSAFQVPNEIVDDGWLRSLGGAEIKVLLFIIRKTFGFNKISGDSIPLSQIQQGTNLTRQTCVDAGKVLEECGLIKIVRRSQEDGTKLPNFYRLVTRNDYNRNR